MIMKKIASAKVLFGCFNTIFFVSTKYVISAIKYIPALKQKKNIDRLYSKNTSLVRKIQMVYTEFRNSLVTSGKNQQGIQKINLVPN